MKIYKKMGNSTRQELHSRLHVLIYYFLIPFSIPTVLYVSCFRLAVFLPCLHASKYEQSNAALHLLRLSTVRVAHSLVLNVSSSHTQGTNQVPLLKIPFFIFHAFHAVKAGAYLSFRIDCITSTRL